MPSFDPPSLKKRKHDDSLTELHLKLASHHSQNLTHPIHSNRPTQPLRKRARPLPFPHVDNGHLNAPSPSPKKASPVLSPCHICHRKPTVRRDLDSYGDCEACGERTCFICLRECLGPVVREEEGDRMGMSFEMGVEGEGDAVGQRWDRRSSKRHWGVVCSRCCCERGVDGLVWCLGCLGEAG